MDRLVTTSFGSAQGRPWMRPAPFRGVAWLLGAVAWTGAAVVGAVFALALTAALLVLAAISSLFLSFAAAGVRAGRSLGHRREGAVLEARPVGGHSWVAYGWDRDA